LIPSSRLTDKSINFLVMLPRYKIKIRDCPPSYKMVK
jgi:hypothetical protein